MSKNKSKDKSIVEIKGLAVETRLAFCADGRLEPRLIHLDLRFEIGLARSISNDRVRDSVDFEYVIARLRRIIGANSYYLGEKLAAHACEIMLADQHIRWIEVSLHDNNPKWGTEDIVIRHTMHKRRVYAPYPSEEYKRKSRRIRILGALAQLVGYVVHAVCPKKRWEMPSVSSANGAIDATPDKPIPRIIWQTNFSNKCTYPLWQNYLRNRRNSRDFEHRYVSTEERESYIRKYAPERVVKAYMRLTDGAAQADLWRLIVLYYEGGVYIDFDGTLVRPLSDILGSRKHFFIWDRKRTSNYFFAAEAKSPIIKRCIDIAVECIEKYNVENGQSVFFTTGPSVLEAVLDPDPTIEYVPRQECCVQGAFASEYFQYMDRPRSKWTYKDSFIAP